MPIQVTHFCQQKGRWWLWALALILPLSPGKALSFWRWSISEEASRNHQGASAWGFQQKKNSELLALASDFIDPFIGIPLPRHWADLWTHKVTGPALTVTGTGLRWRWHKPGVKVTVVLSLQRSVEQPGVRTEASSGLGVLNWVPATALAMRVTGLAVVPIHPRVSVY